MKALGTGAVLLSLAACSKLSSPEITQESTTPSPANPATTNTAPASASQERAPANAGPSQLAQAPAAPVPGNGDVPPAPAPGAAPAPALRPHPAAGAKEAAMKIYPELAVKGSTFNKTFLDLYAEKAQQDPEFLTKADWPLLLARRTAELLAPLTSPPAPAAVASAPPNSAPPAAGQAAPSAPSAPSATGHSFNPVAGPSALDRGSYHQTRSPYWRWNGYNWVYYGPVTPAPAPAAGPAGSSTPTPGALDRGPYNQNRSPYWWPWTRYYYP
ncbi:MAG: hypothetical protein ACAI37_09215 [Chthoniobacter sp.]